ncbi:ATP-binding protein [Streptomyces sp. ST1015]|uniref:sensor histidine kinase n=1 Tax=unclassified Streptomyces TaxID=2593676 RepID=UPI00292E839D|nr:ATP-binding protein [Streptomyces sp. ST1015]
MRTPLRIGFRRRVFVLVMLVTVAATGATAWLTLRQATTQVRESAEARQQDVLRITEGLREYGLAHGTWDGVAATVRSLAERTGQRILISDDSGILLADSDTLLGLPSRPPSTAPAVVVDPRPALRFAADAQPLSLVKFTATAIDDYRTGTAYAVCLTRSGVDVTYRVDRNGIPVHTGEPATACEREHGSRTEFQQHLHAAESCRARSAPALAPCLEQVFRRRTADIAPGQLRVGLGAQTSVRSLAVGPTVAVAAGVAAAAIAAVLLLSRAVLRPVRALTEASRGLGGGDLGHRVPVGGGRDEIAELGRSFNRMADSLQSSEERQRRLVGDIAHELRTPLANLRGYLEALRDGVVEPEPALLDSLHEEVLLQQRIVDDLQDLALAEAGTLTYHRAAVDVQDVLETCRAAHRALAENASSRIVVEPGEGEGPTVVLADPGRLRQAVGNLITNAVRATASGGTVTLNSARKGARVEIRVGDTGKGIPAEQLPYLFDRFWRADAARGRDTGGSGLGLSIARQIVTDHDGYISVRSTVGVGTTFTVDLPAFDGNGPSPAASTGDGTAPPSAGGDQADQHR